MDWQALCDPSKPQFAVLVVICVIIGYIIAMISIARETGKSLSNVFEPFSTIFFILGSILKWIFKGLGFLLVFISALFRKEAPPSLTGTSEQEENLDDFEDDENRPRKPRKIDEYHV